MSAAPLPADEEARVAELRASAILDTPPEQAWDDLTLIASTVCQTPIALASLIDESRQWFKSRVGLGATETPREQAFCAHAILGRGVFEVPDATADERFRDNPLVTGDPDIRFYAGAPIVTTEGHALGTVCVIDRKPRSLTDQQRRALEALARQASAQFALRAHAHRLRAANALTDATLEAVGDAIVCVDPENNVVLCNERFQTMFGFSVVQGTRNPLVENAAKVFRDPAAFHRMMAEQDARPASDSFSTFELLDGRAVERYSRPAVSRGRVLGRVNCYRDVTDRRQIENLKNEFVSTVSHELRTPLTSIRGALGLLEGGVLGELPEQAREFITISRTNCDRLIRLVSDMLDLEKVEGGHLELKRGALDVRALVETAAGNVRSMGAVGRIDCHVSVERVIGDEDRIVQVLTNLLSNAAKFSPPDGVVEVAALPAARGVRFEVRDRGPGIPASARHKLFRRFQQVEQSDARPKGGTGLGLAISKAIVEQHRGAIGVEEREGGGSVFWFTLPLEEGAPADAKVLIAVAHPDFAARLEAAVRGAGATPVVAGTLAAVGAAFERGGLRAALLGLRLPDGDVVEWLTGQRARGAMNLPVALVHEDSGSFAPPLIIDTNEASADARLLRGLCEAAGKRARVLIADDDASFRQVIAAQLRLLHVEVVEAADGSEALAVARRTKPDLIVLDVGMPGLDGFDVVDTLRRESGRPALLVYSGRSLADADRERLRLGATRFLTKGAASEQQFLDAVRQLVTAATAD